MTIIGTRVLRKEDPQFLTVGATYTADLDDPRLDGALCATFVRSFVANGKIIDIDADDARAMPGVALVLTGADLDLMLPGSVPMFPPDLLNRPVLARDRVRFVGEPVAVVLSETRSAGQDAADGRFQGRGCPEATLTIERMFDLFAAQTGIDPIELRRKNLIAADAFPVTTAVGSEYDTGDYEAALDKALEASGYAELRSEQSARRSSGDPVQIGVGVANYVEITAGPAPGGSEYGKVEITPAGKARVYSGALSHGQGHATTFAMIAAEKLGLGIEDIEVVQGDTHVAVVEVDTETGGVELKRMVTVDDAGTLINPLIVEGQRHGGIAQGVAQALLEELCYDEDGNPVTSNFADYSIISAAELPSFELEAMETPTPNNPLGAKGIGESGAIGSTPAVQSAVIDALSHLGVRHIDIPLSPQKVWSAIAEASS